MKAKEFPEMNVKVAENQPQFETLPAHYDPRDGSLTFCFELDEDEINKMVATNELWFKLYVGSQPMQPIALTTIKEHMIPKEGWYITPIKK